MKPEADFDTHLACQLDDAPLPDHGFTRAVTARMERHRRHRRLALAGAVALAGLIVAIGIYLSPVPVFSFADITPDTIVATLLLLTACGLVWIGTESRPPARTAPERSTR